MSFPNEDIKLCDHTLLYFNRMTMVKHSNEEYAMYINLNGKSFMSEKGEIMTSSHLGLKETPTMVTIVKMINNSNMGG